MRKYVCPYCDAISSNISGKLFKCEKFAAMVFSKNVPKNYIVKMMFQDGKIVTMFHAQLEQYFKTRKMIIFETDDEVVVNILSDEATSVLVDSRSTVIDIKHD